MIAAVAAAQPPLYSDPYAIFAKARENWEETRYPAQVAYRVVIRVWKHGTESVAHYDSYFDARQNKVIVKAVSDEEIAHPYTPHGIRFGFKPLGIGRPVPLGAPEQTFDYLGVPVLGPAYSFGVAPEELLRVQSDNTDRLVEEVRHEFGEAPKKAAPEAPRGLKTIASIATAPRDYAIMLQGIDRFDDKADYHLLLRPLHDPQRLRLREMWIDSKTLQTDALMTQGNFQSGGMVKVPWKIKFQRVAGATYIASETTVQPFAVARRAYDSATIEFTDVRSYDIPPYLSLTNFLVDAETGVPPLVEPSL